MSAMLDVWASTSISMAQLIKLHYLSIFDLDVLGLSSWIKTFSHTPSGVTKFAGKIFSSDLRKLTAVSESLSKSKIIYSVIEKII